MREKLNARSVDELFEIANAMQRGEDPAEYLEKKKAAEEAAARKAAEEKEAARKAASEEKEAAKKAAAEKAASGDSEEELTSRKGVGRTLRETLSCRFAFGNRGKEERPEEEEPETPLEGVTERRYGAGSVSREAETVGNRILRSLHMEHLEEAPSDETVEELVGDIDRKEETEEDETSKEVSGEEIPEEETPDGPLKEEKSEEDSEGTETFIEEDKKEENSEESFREETEGEDLKEETEKENLKEEAEKENLKEETKEENEEEFKEEETEEDDEDFWKNLGENDEEEEITEEENGEEKKTGRLPMIVLAAIAGVIILLMVILGIASVTASRRNGGSEPEAQEQEAQMVAEDTEAPVVTARKEDGEITLTAEDSGSGVSSIWYAVVHDNDYLSLPQYQKYSVPISYERGCTYYFYAVDRAGNRSAPLVTPMQSAVYPPADASGETTVSISAIGDCTLGTDRYAASSYSFDSYYTLNGASYFFENVRDILEEDDITFANLEGPLTASDSYVEKEYIFKGDPSYTEILTDGSVETVTLANNHTSDYGEQGLLDTEEALDQAGIAYCLGSEIAFMDVSGVNVAFIGIYAPYLGEEYEVQVRETIEEARNEGASLIIVAFHWGTENSNIPDEGCRQLAHTAVDCGADLVVGHHPHVLQGIEKYNGKYIVYSLANFCFGGNSAPSDQDTMIFRQTFTITDGVVAQDDDIEVIPCKVSSDSGYNDYRPTPAEGEEAEEILERIREYSEALEETL